MGSVTLAIAAIALFASVPAHGDPLSRWQPYIDEASVRSGVPAVWIKRVMRAESAGQTWFHGKPITSSAGAMGLMQLMPVTWAAMRAELDLGADPYEPRDNILAGAFYLRQMYGRFGYPGLFAAYNAGPGRYADHLATGRPLPGETRGYLAAVVGTGPPVIAAPMRAPPSLFYGLSPEVQTTGASSLFVTLSGPANRR